MLQRIGLNGVGAIINRPIFEEIARANKTKHYVKTKWARVGAACGSPLYREFAQENKENFNMVMSWMFERPKGAPTKEKIKNQNTISDEQCSPLQNAGITLIALIITIILLLILAGVAIHFTLGENGILKNAEIAGNKYKKTGENEANLLEEIEGYMNGDRNYPENTPDTNAGSRVAMPEAWYRRNCCYI